MGTDVWLNLLSQARAATHGRPQHGGSSRRAAHEPQQGVFESSLAACCPGSRKRRTKDGLHAIRSRVEGPSLDLDCVVNINIGT